MQNSTLTEHQILDPVGPSGLAESKRNTVLREVDAAQDQLRTRLAGALTELPPGVSADALPGVPVIDIGPSFDGTTQSSRAVAAQIRAACLTTGFFQISNHGVTEDATAAVLTQAQRFFHELSPAQRQALHIQYSPIFRGYEPPEASYVNPDDGKAPTAGEPSGQQQETKQAFNWGYEEAMDPTGGDGKYVELDGIAPSATGAGNVFPAEADLPGFHDALSLYYGQILQLARHLFRLFALSLDLDESYFDPLVTHPGGMARLLYYRNPPPADGDLATSTDHDRGETKQQLGLGAHTDYECFTLLLSSSNPGLEILFPPSPVTADRPIWRPCPVRPGTLTVNVADFLMRWTNGLYKSTVHRVVSPPGAGDRYSVPFFFSINYDSEVDALPEFCVGKSQFLPMKAGEYVLERLRATRQVQSVDA